MKPRRAYDAVVRTRASLTLIEGLGSRIHQTVSPRGAANTPRWRLLALGSAVLDIAKARRLAATDDFELWPRLVLDVADLAVWSFAAHDDTDTSEDSVIPGVALAAEAGARLGPAAFVIPIVNASVAAAIRHARGHRLRLEQFSWQAMGVTGGWMLSVFARRRRTALQREHDVDLRAQLQGAELAGLHDVVMTNEGAIDVLQRATALIDLGGGAPRRRDFAGAFKADVAAAVRSHATYLRDALMVWQTRHNMQPELRRTVSIDLVAEAGTILLDESQVASLHGALDSLTLAGRVHIEPADWLTALRPYGDRDLLVGDVRVALPNGTGERMWTFDAIPTAFLMGIGWTLQPMGDHREGVPFSATAVPLSIGVGATIWSARRVDRDGIASPRVALALSFTSALLYTVASNRTMRHPHTERLISRYPWTLPLQGYELVRSITGPHLEQLDRRIAAAGTAAVIVAGWTLAPRPRSLRALAAELQWTAGTVIGARQLRDAIQQHATEVASLMRQNDERDIAIAYRRGRARANTTIAAAVADARRILNESKAHLDPELFAEARRRLQSAELIMSGR